MRKASVDGCLTKADRAMAHIDEINEELAAGKLSLDGKAIDAKHDPETDEMVFHIAGVTNPHAPLLFAVLAGEVVHQLRSALDHLIYELIVANTKEEPTIRSEFPVFWKGDRNSSAATKYKRKKSRKIGGVSHAAEVIIDSLQPFRRGASYHEDLLYVLHDLNNIDKHRTLNLAMNSVQRYTVTLTSRGQSAEAVFEPSVPFESGAVLGRMPLHNPPYDEAEVFVRGRATVEIVFPKLGRHRDVSVIPLLFDLHDYVQDIIGRLVRLPEWPFEYPGSPRPPAKSTIRVE